MITPAPIPPNTPGDNVDALFADSLAEFALFWSTPSTPLLGGGGGGLDLSLPPAWSSVVVRLVGVGSGVGVVGLAVRDAATAGLGAAVASPGTGLSLACGVGAGARAGAAFGLVDMTGGLLTRDLRDLRAHMAQADTGAGVGLLGLLDLVVPALGAPAPAPAPAPPRAPAPAPAVFLGRFLNDTTKVGGLTDFFLEAGRLPGRGREPEEEEVVVLPPRGLGRGLVPATPDLGLGLDPEAGTERLGSLGLGATGLPLGLLGRLGPPLGATGLGLFFFTEVLVPPPPDRGRRGRGRGRGRRPPLLLEGFLPPPILGPLGLGLGLPGERGLGLGREPEPDFLPREGFVGFFGFRRGLVTGLLPPPLLGPLGLGLGLGLPGERGLGLFGPLLLLGCHRRFCVGQLVVLLVGGRVGLGCVGN